MSQVSKEIIDYGIVDILIIVHFLGFLAHCLLDRCEHIDHAHPAAYVIMC